MKKHLSKGSKVLVLEFGKPDNFFLKKLFNLYLLFIPYLAFFLTSSLKPYQHLCRSINEFPYGKLLIDIARSEDLLLIKKTYFSFGVARAYLFQL